VPVSAPRRPSRGKGGGRSARRSVARIGTTDERFGRAFAEAKATIASMSGFGSLALRRCIEQSSRYLLLVYDPFQSSSTTSRSSKLDRVPRNAGSGRAFEEAENVADRDLGPVDVTEHKRDPSGRLCTSTTFVSLAHEIYRRTVVVR
jgi:hypothetical protein